eukprot:14984706-Heterocapsa_arctica.AAC.1
MRVRMGSSALGGGRPAQCLWHLVVRSTLSVRHSITSGLLPRGLCSCPRTFLTKLSLPRVLGAPII